MLEIQDTLVSLELIRKKFCCDLKVCLGGCCVFGDSGAPLTLDETGFLDDHLDALRPYLRPEGIRALLEQGMYVTDMENEIVTPLINGKECAYTFFENGIAFCAIEKAYRAGAIPFNKPVSCHLYPVRLKAYRHYTAVNYDEWEICRPAHDEGESLGILLYRFLEEALVRKFGREWFEQLDYAAKNLQIERHAG
jgi:hypothetical protein